MGNNQTKQRLAIFDGYKGFSIIAIILYYFYQHLLPGGYLAVNFFLLVAGFFNFRYFYVRDLQHRPLSALHFYRRRFERLFFPMLAMILSTGTIILLFARDFMFNLRNMALSSLLFVNNYYQIFNEQSYFVQAANPSPFTHLWYVGILAQLILLTPVLFFLFYSWHRKPSYATNMLLIVSAVSAGYMAFRYQDGMDPTGVYYSVLTRASAYTFGAAIGLLFPIQLNPKPLQRQAKLILNSVGTVCLILMIIMMKFMYGTQPFAYHFGMTLYTIVAGLFLIATIHSDTFWHKVLSLKIFTFLGQRSYSYYLWFYPVYLIIARFIRPLNLSFGMNMACQFIILMILAEINYQFFELQRVSLPLGQDFNIRKSIFQFKFLKNHPHKLKSIKIFTASYALIAILGFAGIIAAPETKGDTANNIQSVIEKNKKLIEETQNENTDSTKIVNNIEGLDQQELLYANGLEVTFIGDSVLLAAADEVRQVFPKSVINGEVGRQLYNSVSTIHSLNNQNLMKQTVVTTLGNNGTFTPGQINDYINAIGQNHDIFFVTATADRSWVADANREIYAAAERFGNVHVIDWASYSQNHQSWNEDDFGHLTEEGSQEFAKYIASELFRQR